MTADVGDRAGTDGETTTSRRIVVLAKPGDDEATRRFVDALEQRCVDVRVVPEEPHGEDEVVAVVDRAVGELTDELWAVIATSDVGWDRVEAMVRGVFRLAMRRPELLGLLRELTRLGPPALDRATAALEPLIKGATEWLHEEMRQGRVRRSDPRLLAFSVYSTVMGVATEVEVLRAVGVEPTLRDAALRRRELLRFLRSALQPAPAA